MAEIRFENIHKAYGALTVLKDLSLDIEDGEFLVLVGPSGCGKSTALKILAGLEEATAGRVMIGERDVTDMAPGRRDIAMVFQNYALYPHLSVRANMGFSLKVRGVPAQDVKTRVENAARILGIEDYLDRRPRALSGGQRQRVALGRAIVREPQAFLMDEPLSNLDAKLRVQMRSEITALHRRLNVTTIYVTHDQTEAMTMADRIVIMRHGVVQQVADPDGMYEKPSNTFVAGFIGSPGMNFLQADVRDGHVVVVDVAVPVRKDLAATDGQRVIVGCRPELIEINPSSAAITLPIVNVEKFGGATHVHLDLPDSAKVTHQADLGIDDQVDRFIVRVEGRFRAEPGDHLPIGIAPDVLHYFDPQSGRAL